jgi:hypothetical protein
MSLFRGFIDLRYIPVLRMADSIDIGVQAGNSLAAQGRHH